MLINRLIITSFSLLLVSACVTKNYENNADTPIVENTSTNNEIALTRLSLAMGYLNMGNTTQAKLNLEKAKRYAPKLTKVHTAFAQYYDEVDEPEQAIKAFEHALSLEENDADTLNNYGVFLCKQAKYDESETMILRAIAVPSYLLVSQSYENLALCQLENKQFEKAEMYLAKSISHSPSGASALFQMLRLQYVMSNYDEAIQYLRRYEKSTRRFTPQALALAYKIYEKMNNQRIAKNYAGMLVKMFPNAYESKQYILNGLQHIEADDLKTEYLLVGGAKSNQPKKRVMVLSPNSKSGISLASEKAAKSQQKSTIIAKKPIENPTTITNTFIENKALNKTEVNETALNEAEFPNSAEETPVIKDLTTDDGQVASNSIGIKQTVTNQEGLPANQLDKVDETPSTTDNFIESPLAPIEDDNFEVVDNLSAASDDGFNEVVNEAVNESSLLEENIAQNKAEIDQAKIEVVNETLSETLNEPSKETAVNLPTHTVVKGETLFAISKKYNIRMDKIESWNNIDRLNGIKTNDVIYLSNPKQ